MTTLRKQS